MRKGFLNVLILIVVGLFCLNILGCAVRFQKRHPKDIETIEELSRRLKQLEETKSELEVRLQEEIAKGKVSLEMQDRGLVVTVIDKVLFDSGKAKIRSDGKSVLEKVAEVLAKIDKDIIIEGHTDNVPIKYSGWKSNWELSAHRALNVLHYFVDEKGLKPERFSAAGYGPYRPVASNATEEGRQKNRRVEIIILPTKIQKKEVGVAPQPSRDKEYIK